jgi:hypothetical protein
MPGLTLARPRPSFGAICPPSEIPGATSRSISRSAGGRRRVARQCLFFLRHVGPETNHFGRRASASARPLCEAQTDRGRKSIRPPNERAHEWEEKEGRSRRQHARRHVSPSVESAHEIKQKQKGLKQHLLKNQYGCAVSTEAHLAECLLSNGERPECSCACVGVLLCSDAAIDYAECIERSAPRPCAFKVGAVRQDQANFLCASLALWLARVGRTQLQRRGGDPRNARLARGHCNRHARIFRRHVLRRRAGHLPPSRLRYEHTLTCCSVAWSTGCCPPLIIRC